jgi:hypothetical protein
MQDEHNNNYTTDVVDSVQKTIVIAYFIWGAVSCLAGFFYFCIQNESFINSFI